MTQQEYSQIHMWNPFLPQRAGKRMPSLSPQIVGSMSRIGILHRVFFCCCSSLTCVCMFVCQGCWSCLVLYPPFVRNGSARCDLRQLGEQSQNYCSPCCGILGRTNPSSLLTEWTAYHYHVLVQDNENEFPSSTGGGGFGVLFVSRGFSSDGVVIAGYCTPRDGPVASD